MSLTRKRKKELKALRKSAEQLWSQQQELLAQANVLAARAKRQAVHYTREEIAPRVRKSYEHYVLPAAESAKDTVGHYADAARDRLVHDVIPAVGGAFGTAMSVVDQARAARAKALVQQSLSRAKNSSQLGTTRSRGGFGKAVAITLGTAAVLGVAYAVWQTFRSDDELWVSDEHHEVSPSH